MQGPDGSRPAEPPARSAAQASDGQTTATLIVKKSQSEKRAVQLISQLEKAPPADRGPREARTGFRLGASGSHAADPQSFSPATVRPARAALALSQLHRVPGPPGPEGRTQHSPTLLPEAPERTGAGKQRALETRSGCRVRCGGRRAPAAQEGLGGLLGRGGCQRKSPPPPTGTCSSGSRWAGPKAREEGLAVRNCKNAALPSVLRKSWRACGTRVHRQTPRAHLGPGQAEGSPGISQSALWAPGHLWGPRAVKKQVVRPHPALELGVRPQRLQVQPPASVIPMPMGEAKLYIPSLLHEDGLTLPLDPQQEGRGPGTRPRGTRRDSQRLRTRAGPGLESHLPALSTAVLGTQGPPSSQEAPLGAHGFTPCKGRSRKGPVPQLLPGPFLPPGTPLSSGPCPPAPSRLPWKPPVIRPIQSDLRRAGSQRNAGSCSQKGLFSFIFDKPFGLGSPLEHTDSWSLGQVFLPSGPTHTLRGTRDTRLLWRLLW